MAVLSQIEFIGGEWMGGGGLGAVVKNSNPNGNAVPSVGDPDWHNSQGRPGLPLELL